MPSVSRQSWGTRSAGAFGQPCTSSSTAALLNPCRCTVATGCTARKSASMARSRCAGGTSVSMNMPTIAELGVVGAPQHVAQQQQRRLVGRVQIVDHQQDGAAGRQLVQRRRHRLEEAEALAFGITALLLDARRVLTEAQDEPGELGELPVGHARNPVRREGLEVAPECLGEGLERRHRILVAAAPQHQCALRFDGVGQLGHQSRLPDARVAVDQQEPPAPRRTDVHQSRRSADSRARPTSGPSCWDAGTRTW